MKIVFEHSTPLPVLRYGGTERVLFWLMKALVRKGHHVSLIGHPQCKLEGTGIQLLPKENEDWRSIIPKTTDIVHLFSSPSKELDFPLIITIEGNGQVGEVFHKNTVFISKKHAENHYSNVFIYNGIDLSEYPFPLKKRKATLPSASQFLFLAKGKWNVKNLKDCIRVCRNQKKFLHIAGGRSWLPSRYLYSYGMVDQKKKLELLEKTEILLAPVRWHEPFGIFIIEAMAMGLPVFGSPYGSLPELIRSNSGLICQNYSEFESAVQKLPHSFYPEEIRNYIENNFSIETIAQQYIELYEKIIYGQDLHSTPPKTVSTLSPETLLPF